MERRPVIKQKEHSSGDGEGRAAAYRGENLAFIVGAPRSGTTWLQRLIASHPTVRTGQESHLFSHYLAPQLRTWRENLAISQDPAYLGRNGVGLGGYLTEEDFLDVLRSFVIRMLRPVHLGEGDLFLEKSPDHALVIPEIKDILPESRIIHLIRDPRDVVASLLAAGRSWGRNWAPSSAGAAAKQWTNYVHAVSEAAEQLSPQEFMEVRYEELKASPLAVLEEVGHFLQIEWPEEARRRAIQNNTPEMMSEGRGTKIPVYGVHGEQSGRVVEEPDGFVRKAKAGGGAEELSLIEKLIVFQITRPLMQRKGYAWTWSAWM